MITLLVRLLNLILSDPKFKTWSAKNNLVMSWLISSMITRMREILLLYTTTKEIWDSTSDTFSNSENTIELFHVENSL